ncbi:MAG TPA: DEAD/DEAH box helicase [Thermoanaerobaculia bacterium]|jgi:ATP-dependent Lhr-like helicase|nr:DEAD/DEAH box helicase [Thermoanaerobaculia bacterium]
MQSSAFHLLHPKIQRWIWRTDWTELHDVQERAIPAIHGAEKDVVISAATAGGKTEAAFLPILSRLVEDPGGSIRALYVSPLRALINDQFRRLDALCEELQIPVHRWHGDVGAAQKRKVREHPAGVLIITPESLEALFVLRGPEVPGIFARLDFVVVDELHVFLNSERGAQLQSLLHRLELTLRRRVPRIGLSATLGDLGLACEFLRPGQGNEVTQVESRAVGQELRMQVRGYLLAPPTIGKVARAEASTDSATESPSEEDGAGDFIDISNHLFNHLRGGHHLIFANSRSQVEQLADRLLRLCERHRIPNEFWPHHGNLSKELREEAERAIKDSTRPASAVCTTTLELGIDIGAIESVAQIGCPPSVASLRQRLGRSGRQGEPAVLRAYVQERKIMPNTPPHATLRIELVETLAMVELLLTGWCEPPDLRRLHLSTLVQQVLSLVAQHGAIQVRQAWGALCERGPFSGVTSTIFASFLRSLGREELVQQDHSGELVLAERGERLVNHYTFFASFSTPDEYRLTASGRALGTLPVTFPLFPGLHLIFGGKRWRVVHVDDVGKVVDLLPAAGGRPPAFPPRSGPPVDGRVRREMLRLYLGVNIPTYLDSGGRELLREARENFRRMRLPEKALLPSGTTMILFPWCGDAIMDTLVVWLASREVEVRREGLALIFEGLAQEPLTKHLNSMLREEPPSAEQLGLTVSNKIREKFHPFLDEQLLAADYAASLDVPGAIGVLALAIANRLPELDQVVGARGSEAPS